MKQLEELTPDQCAFRYADVCRRAQVGPCWANDRWAVKTAVEDFKKQNAKLARTMEIHLQWEAEYQAGLK